MADIFISYSQNDRAWVRKLVDALTAEGYTVWWDLEIHAGESFDKAIERTLSQTGCVIAVWSQHARDSDWVRAESAWAKGKDKLVSIRIQDELELPIEFFHVHTDNFAAWDGTRNSSEFRKLVADIREIAGPPPSQAQMSGTVAPSLPQNEPERAPEIQPQQEPSPRSRTAPVSRAEFGTSPVPGSSPAVPKPPSGLRPRGVAIGMILLAAAALVGGVFYISTKDKPDPGHEQGGRPVAGQEEAVAAPGSVTGDIPKEGADSHTSNLPADGSEHRDQLKVGESTGAKSDVPAETKPVMDQPIASEPEGKISTDELFLAPGKAKFGARLGANTPDLLNWSSGKWTILETKADLKGRHKEVGYSYKAQPIITLNEGDYKLQVTLGDAKRMVTLHVKPGSPAQGTVVLGAGQVKLMARLSAESPPLQDLSSGKWTILETKADFEGRHKEVGYSYKAQPIITLNEGDYRLRVTVGDAIRIVDLSVKAGEQKSMVVVLGAGQVKLMARLSAGSPPLQDLSSGKWTILETKVDFEGRQKEVAYSYEAQPIKTLNEGNYRLRVTVGDAAQETDLTVKAGEQKVVEVDVTAKRE